MDLILAAHLENVIPQTVWFVIFWTDDWMNISSKIRKTKEAKWWVCWLGQGGKLAMLGLYGFCLAVQRLFSPEAQERTTTVDLSQSDTTDALSCHIHLPTCL